MTALQAHFRLMSQAAQQGRIHTHYKSENKLRTEGTNMRSVFVDGMVYDTVSDATEAFGISVHSVRRMIQRGEGKYLD